MDERKGLEILLEWTKERAIINQTNIWNCFKGSAEETSERWGGAHTQTLPSASVPSGTKRSSARTPLALYNYVRKHFCPYRNQGIHRWGFPQRRAAGPHWSWLPANIADCCQALVWSGSVQSTNSVRVCVCSVCACVCVCSVCVCVCVCVCV